MLIVTGTKRSGTSLWMRVLGAAGLPLFGEAFPGDWQRTLGAANPDGFYESSLREGIYHATNPHPRTGAYFFPEQVEWHVVKVFIPGLVRSDRAYIGRVIATVREWREYAASVARLYALEDAERRAAGDTEPPPRMPAALEWWVENRALLRDVALRRYPVHVQSLDGLLADPQRVIADTLRWIGRGDPAPAVRQVDARRRAVTRAGSDGVEPEVAAAFDELYRAIDERRGLPAALLARLDETDRLLAPRIREHEAALAEDRRRRAARRGAQGAP
jgi:hypothetical protein